MELDGKTIHTDNEIIKILLESNQRLVDSVLQMNMNIIPMIAQLVKQREDNKYIGPNKLFSNEEDEREMKKLLVKTMIDGLGKGMKFNEIKPEDFMKMFNIVDFNKLNKQQPEKRDEEFVKTVKDLFGNPPMNIPKVKKEDVIDDKDKKEDP